MIFATDLDRTLIFSEAFLEESKVSYQSIEIYKEKPISYISDEAIQVLKELSKRVHIIPVTTRNYEQYHRIELFYEVFTPEIYIINNGGSIYVQGKEDQAWKEHITLAINALVAGYDEVLQSFLKDYKGPVERWKKSDDLIWLVLGDKDQIDWQAVEQFKKNYSHKGWKIDVNGRKIYLYPEFINKWAAVQYVQRTYLSEEEIVAAGDSLFDYEMIHKAKWGIIPKNAWIESSCMPYIMVTPHTGLKAGEEILEKVLSLWNTVSAPMNKNGHTIS